ncbi:MAG: thermonuclease family protein [Sphingomonadaceae bacterium]
MGRLIALVLLLLAVPVLARPFDARVLRVKDGDSVVVERVPQKRVMEIRLAGIDAPELGQPWGIQSREALRRMIGGRMVRVEVTDRDRYGRYVGRMWVGRTYVNAEMTRAGHAWAFARYLPDAEIRAGHEAARAAGRGLWSLPPADRLPPATWRQRNPRAPQPE